MQPQTLSKALVPGAKLLFVGEAFAEFEDKLGMPMVGPFGQAIFQILSPLGITRAGVSITNVFNERPARTAEDLWNDEPHRAAALARLGEEIDLARPNLIVAFGNIALRALCNLSGITKLRGHCIQGTLRPVKVLPTLLSLFQSSSARANITVDLIKAAREAESPKLSYTSKTIWIEPTLEDLYAFEAQYIDSAEILSCDIETRRAGRQITCIGFSPRTDVALCIPFRTKVGPFAPHYWDRDSEILAWTFVQKQLLRPIPKLFQNGQYDLHWLASAGFALRGPFEDTMLLHHSQFSEIEKGLEALAAVHANVPPWKTLRSRGGDDAKREG